jgi:hypothetical protein
MDGRGNKPDQERQISHVPSHMEDLNLKKINRISIKWELSGGVNHQKEGERRG